jgi:hypothetical protein
MSDIEQAHKQLTKRIIDLPGVAGVGIGTKHGKPCLKVYLEKGNSGSRTRIPRSLGGFPVSIERSGPFRRQ